MFSIVFLLNISVIAISIIVATLGIHSLDNVCIIMCLLFTIINLVLTFRL